jgi:NAD(P)H-hydrate epimerase
MREIEAAADAAGHTYAIMMEAAGRAVADRVLARLSPGRASRVTILVGPGNNGGDGLVAGRLIAEESEAEIRFYLLKMRDRSDPHFNAIQAAELFVTNADDDRDGRLLRNLIASSDIVVDAVFGIGVRLPLKDQAAAILRQTHQALREAQLRNLRPTSVTPAHPEVTRNSPGRPYIIAVDCPSGLECDSGELDSNTLHADETITFIAVKPGLLSFPGAQAVGTLSVAPIGVPEHVNVAQDTMGILVDSDLVHELLPDRPTSGHKGTFGKALIVAGSVNYVGAPGLAAQAAYRIGSGLVTVGAPHRVIDALSARLPEPTWLLLPHDMGVISDQAAKIIFEEAVKFDALLLGPGLGLESTTRELLTTLLTPDADSAKRQTRRNIGFLSVNEAGTNASELPENSDDRRLPPLVIDADGLNLLSEIDKWWTLVPKNCVLTPHPGEMARLSGLKTHEIEQDRTGIATDKAKEWGVVLVLKGAHTLIADPEGQLAVLPFKTDALATAGTGDILAGAIVGLIAQGMTAYDAAVVGSYLHGLSGAMAGQTSSSRSVIASDVLNHLPEAISLVEQSR